MTFKVLGEKLNVIKKKLAGVLQHPKKQIKLRHSAQLIGKVVVLKIAILPTRLKLERC